MLTVACVLKSGGDFDFSDVDNLYAQLLKNLRIVFKFVVLTDMEDSTEQFECIPLVCDFPGYWSKLELFRPNLLTGKVIYFDLDTVVFDNIDILAIYPHRFSMLRPFSKERKFGGWASGIMAWQGDFSYIYNSFIRDYKGGVPKDRAGDQKYISKYLVFEPDAIQDIQKGIYSYKKHCTRFVPHDAHVVCFHGLPRPKDVGLTKSNLEYAAGGEL